MAVLEFREAVLSDLPILLTLEQAVVEAERPFNGQIQEVDPHYYDIPDLIQSNKAVLLVAESDGAIVATGYAQIRQSKQSLVHAQHAYLGFMWVAPAFRGQGLNQRLISRLMDWSKQRGIQDFYLDVYAGNQAAIKAYEKLGFEASLVEMKLHED